MNIKKFLWSIVLATCCMIIHNGVFENAIEFAYEELVIEFKIVPVDYYFSCLVHNRGQQGH